MSHNGVHCSSFSFSTSHGGPLPFSLSDAVFGATYATSDTSPGFFSLYIVIVGIWPALIFSLSNRCCISPLHLRNMTDTYFDSNTKHWVPKTGPFLGPEMCPDKGAGEQWAFSFSGTQFCTRKRPLFGEALVGSRCLNANCRETNNDSGPWLVGA